MTYLYDRTFKTGVALGVFLFLVLNVISYIIADRKYDEYIREPIKFAPLMRLRWGFPFIWDGYNFGYNFDGALNILIAAGFGIIMGLIFKFFDHNLAVRSK